MAKIRDVNYKKVVFKKMFSVHPDWLLPIMNEYGLKAIDRLVYFCLYQHADTKTNICFPSYDKLKEYTGIKNNSSIKQSINRLVKVGLIEVVKKGYYDEEKKVQMANTYRIRYLYPDDFKIKYLEV